MERRVDEPDDDREPGHLPQDAHEVLPLHPTEVLQRSDVPPREVFEAGINFGELAFEISTTVVCGRLDFLYDPLPPPFYLSVLRPRQDHLIGDPGAIGF